MSLLPQAAAREAAQAADSAALAAQQRWDREQGDLQKVARKLTCMTIHWHAVTESPHVVRQLGVCGSCSTAAQQVARIMTL